MTAHVHTAQGQGPGTMLDLQMLMLMQQMIYQQMSSGVEAPGSLASAADPGALTPDDIC